ncbi:hypothetical protein BJY19_003367 [Arthrobacter cupressi]|nr:hypothetical protein [Arthrobacter cupressi]
MDAARALTGMFFGSDIFNAPTPPKAPVPS